MVVVVAGSQSEIDVSADLAISASDPVEAASRRPGKHRGSMALRRQKKDTKRQSKG
jgi:hypothetical protein